MKKFKEAYFLIDMALVFCKISKKLLKNTCIFHAIVVEYFIGYI